MVLENPREQDCIILVPEAASFAGLGKRHCRTIESRRAPNSVKLRRWRSYFYTRSSLRQ